MSENENPAQPLFTVWRRNEGETVPIVVVAIHGATWDHIRSGNTAHFDFSGVGVPAKLIVFGAPDRASARDTLEAVVGKFDVDLQGRCFGIAELSGDEQGRH